MGIETWSEDGLLGCIEAHEREVAHHQGQVDKLKAEKARREAEAKKTVGQRVAESDIFREGCAVGIPVCGYVWWQGLPNGVAAEVFAANLKQYVASAIDKVRADTIEKCAKAVEAIPGGAYNDLSGIRWVRNDVAARHVRAVN